jgi:dolichol kinase
MRPVLLAILLSSSTLLMSGCVVVAVVDTAASLAVGAVGLVGDAAIGTVKVAGKVVGATADAILPAGK